MSKIKFEFMLNLAHNFVGNSLQLTIFKIVFNKRYKFI